MGDDDQSIYAWRGANPDNLLQLGSDYPQLKIVKLEQNYRCCNRVLRAANALIANNPHEHPKTLWSDQADGERIRVWECRTMRTRRKRSPPRSSSRPRSSGAPWSDFCILFRGNFQSRALEKALQLLRVPYHLTGGTAFLDRGEVKDAMAWLRLVANPDDDAAFLRAVQSPKREVGATTLAKLAELAQHAHLPLSRAAESVGLLKQLAPRAANALGGFVDIAAGPARRRRAPAAGRTGAPAQRAQRPAGDAARAVQGRGDVPARGAATSTNSPTGSMAARRPSGPGELAAALALLSHADKGDAGNQVRLMSLHAAKGLEFRYVFIVGVEDGILPHEASLEEGRLDEERRLLYVGITRAKEQLWLSHAREAQKLGRPPAPAAQPLPRRAARRRTAARRRRSGRRRRAQAGTRQRRLRRDPRPAGRLSGRPSPSNQLLSGNWSGIASAAGPR